MKLRTETEEEKRHRIFRLAEQLHQYFQYSEFWPSMNKFPLAPFPRDNVEQAVPFVDLARVAIFHTDDHGQDEVVRMALKIPRVFEPSGVFISKSEKEATFTEEDEVCLTCEFPKAFHFFTSEGLSCPVLARKEEIKDGHT